MHTNKCRKGIRHGVKLHVYNIIYKYNIYYIYDYIILPCTEIIYTLDHAQAGPHKMWTIIIIQNMNFKLKLINSKKFIVYLVHFIYLQKKYI